MDIIYCAIAFIPQLISGVLMQSRPDSSRRRSNGGFDGSIKPIVIPPPRPKRKPVHPYPRKSVDLVKGKSPASQTERSPSPNQFFREQDNKSPTSVLSDAMGYSTLEQQKGCSSPTSSTTNLQSINTSPFEKETDYATSNLAVEEEKPSLPFMKLFSQSDAENILSMDTATEADVEGEPNKVSNLHRNNDEPF
ncbi:hypothetical protein Gotri_012534 [Gossypium trilobum]|uniref:Uncharacterized protein n=1 Tax=Gossypium trilobum TaxID=34281 RepID=A0A7J9DR12_9ROSI|nr:hypothetical protein [Gossypium trilobum]